MKLVIQGITPSTQPLRAVTREESWAGDSSFNRPGFWVLGVRLQNPISLQHDKTLEIFLPGAVMFKHQDHLYHNSFMFNFTYSMERLTAMGWGCCTWEQHST